MCPHQAALRSSSREQAPCRTCCPEHALGHEPSGSRSTLEARERVFSVPVSCHICFLPLESVLAGQVGPAGSGHVTGAGCSLDILARPLQTMLSLFVTRSHGWTSLGGICCHRKEAATCLLSKWLLDKASLVPRVPLCELEGTLVGQTQPHGTSDCHMGHRWKSAFTDPGPASLEQGTTCTAVVGAVPQAVPQLHSQSPQTLIDHYL